MAKESPDPYYQQLVGKVFEGTFTRVSGKWMVVEANDLGIKADLDKIVEIFKEERIWKGIDKGCLFANPDDKRDWNARGKKKYYKIDGYMRYDIPPEFSRTGNYDRGYYFILTNT